jgi:hypothetical protein
MPINKKLILKNDKVINNNSNSIKPSFRFTCQLSTANTHTHTYIYILKYYLDFESIKTY